MPSHPIEVDVDGQVYRFVEHEEYPNAKCGYLTVWQSNCPTCGAAFQAKTSSAFAPKKITRRCELHRRPGVPVGKIAPTP